MDSKPGNATPNGTCLNVSIGAVPQLAAERLSTDAPVQLTLIGNTDLLGQPKTALFCSARCPGNAILAALDQAARWREEGRCVIGGFQAPLEQECLRVLLRGTQSIIICPARGLSAASRVPPEWKAPLAAGRLLLVSGFDASVRRVTQVLAWRRNLLVAALADDVFFAHIAPGGHLDRLAREVATLMIHRNIS